MGTESDEKINYCLRPDLKEIIVMRMRREKKVENSEEKINSFWEIIVKLVGHASKLQIIGLLVVMSIFIITHHYRCKI